MSALTVILLLANVALIVVYLWAILAIAQYAKEGKAFAVAFTPFWLFNPDWFTEEGQGTFRKERLKVAVAIIVFLGAGYFLAG